MNQSATFKTRQGAKKGIVQWAGRSELKTPLGRSRCGRWGAYSHRLVEFFQKKFYNFSAMIWKGIKETGFKYEASEIGEIRLVGSTYIRKAHLSKGYFKVRVYILRKDGEMKETTISVHKLVCSAFHDNPEKKPCVRHLDCNSMNNAASNLCWGTHIENYADGRRLGRYGPPSQPYVKKGCASRRHVVVDILSGIEYPSVRHMPLPGGLTWKYLQRMLNGERRNHTNFRYKKDIA
jgi:hypothetical protein